MKKIKLGLVGCGVYQGGHGRGGGLISMAGRLFPNVELRSACDTNPVARGYLQKSCPDVPVYPDYQEMLDKAALDAVIVATPVTNHARFSTAALQRDISVLSEIPMPPVPG